MDTRVLAVCVLWAAAAAQGAVIISEIVDGDLTGGNPKYVELTNCGNQPVIFGPSHALRVYFNGALIPSTTVPLDGILVAPGQAFVIASAANTGDLQYLATYGDNADLYTFQFFGNGDDVYSLELGNEVLDTFGQRGVDGSGLHWEYTDSYVRSQPGRSPSPLFSADDWIYGGVGALDAPNAPSAIQLLLANTSPKSHNCGGAGCP